MERNKPAPLERSLCVPETGAERNGTTNSQAQEEEKQQQQQNQADEHSSMRAPEGKPYVEMTTAACVRWRKTTQEMEPAACVRWRETICRGVGAPSSVWSPGPEKHVPTPPSSGLASLDDIVVSAIELQHRGTEKGTFGRVSICTQSSTSGVLTLPQHIHRGIELPPGWAVWRNPTPSVCCTQGCSDGECQWNPGHSEGGAVYSFSPLYTAGHPRSPRLSTGCPRVKNPGGFSAHLSFSMIPIVVHMCIFDRLGFFFPGCRIFVPVIRPQ